MFASKAKARSKSALPGVAANASSTPGNGSGKLSTNNKSIAEEEASTLPHQVTQAMIMVNDYWDYMTVENFNPVPHALALLDTSSLGNDVKSFMAAFEKVQGAMDTVVNDYHNAFQVNIQIFSQVVDHITDARKNTTGVKSNLNNCKDFLGSKRFDLLHLWIKGIQLAEMTRILDTVDEIQQTPEKLESLVSGKYYLTAIRTLIQTERTLVQQEYVGIGALENVRNRLKEFKVSIYELVIDEIHAHVYSSGLTVTGPILLDEEITKRAASEDEKLTPVVEDLSADPDTNSREFLTALIETLYLLDRLPEGMGTVWERAPIELYYVVERTIQEISLKNLATDTRQDQIRVLLKLIADVFSKFKNIIKSHLFIVNTIKLMIRTHKDIPDTIYRIEDMWALVFNELKVFLYDYLSNPLQTTSLNNSSLIDLLKRKREPIQSAVGNSSKMFYHIGGSSTSDYVRKLYRDLDQTGRDIVSLQHVSKNQTQVSVGIVDKYASLSAAGHKLLIQPDPYNILIIYQPTCQFATDIESEIGVSADAFQAFLDDFILHVFLPQMSARVNEYYETYVNGSDAYQTEYALNLSQLPLTKSAVALMLMLRGMCKTLYGLPVHQDEVIKMMESVLIRYNDQCSTRYRHLLASDHGEESDRPVISGLWVNEPELLLLLDQHYTTFHEFLTSSISPMAKEESRIEMNLKKDRSFHRSELIFAPKRMEGLANLHFAMEWFGSQVELLVQSRPETATHHPATKAPKPLVEKSVTESELFTEFLKVSTESLPQLSVELEEDIQLSLTREMQERFQALLKQCTKLSHICLFSIRLEIRCHCMFFLDLALREGNYLLEGEVFEPDSYISLLNQDLISLEEVLSASLTREKCIFIFHGLSQLISHFLRSGIKQIRCINEAGVMKLIRNTASLQQCLTSVTQYQDMGLELVFSYFDLLRNKEKNAFLEACQRYKGSFTYEEAKLALDLLYARELEQQNTESNLSSSASAHASNSPNYAQVLAVVKEFFVKNR